MLTHKYIKRIVCGVMMVAVCIVFIFMNGESLGIKRLSAKPQYESKLFSQDKVHQIDIRIDDWDEFLENSYDEEYWKCDVVIDGEAYHNVGLRIKGNSSKRLVHDYGLQRYNLKIEFDHYHDQYYHGLDQLSLDGSFQDNSYMKTWLTFDMMRYMQVPTPLCSYTWVTVNGEDWGLFLAMEEIEESFALRNYGKDHGKLYKPDYMSLDDENADVALRYTGDEFYKYDNIFRNAQFDINDEEKKRLINSLKILSEGENLEEAIDVDEVLRYFTVQVFVVNLDSYLGKTGHNYFLYEEDGKLQMLPWDYNLAFTTYSLGMPNPINDAELYVNYPIDTPASGEIMMKRPLYHNVMKNDTYFNQYHEYFDELISEYFESGYFKEFIAETYEMIESYVEKEPTAFCTYEEFQVAVETLYEFCDLRAQSIRGQLEGTLPSTIKEQSENPNRIDASSIWLPDLGELKDLED